MCILSSSTSLLIAANFIHKLLVLKILTTKKQKYHLIFNLLQKHIVSLNHFNNYFSSPQNLFGQELAIEWMEHTWIC